MFFGLLSRLFFFGWGVGWYILTLDLPPSQDAIVTNNGFRSGDWLPSLGASGMVLPGLAGLLLLVLGCFIPESPRFVMDSPWGLRGWGWWWKGRQVVWFLWRNFGFHPHFFVDLHLSGPLFEMGMLFFQQECCVGAREIDWLGFPESMSHWILSRLPQFGRPSRRISKNLGKTVQLQWSTLKMGVEL